MFHVLLVAPLLGLLAAYGIVVLIVLSVPFCLGGFFQLVLTIAAGDRWAVWVPAGLGVLGPVLSLLAWGDSMGRYPALLGPVFSVDLAYLAGRGAD